MQNGAGTVHRLIKKLHIKTHQKDPVIPLGVHTQGIESRGSNRYLYSRVHSNIIHKSQKEEATQVATERQVTQGGICVKWNVTEP